jgi:prepilin-type N-terminal cleavage/methylation domain-containing protein
VKTGVDPHRRLECQDGFTLPELLISVVIMMVTTASVFSLLSPSTGASKAQPEVSDMQQRLRVAVDTVTKDLLMAGAGTYSGSAVGTLGNYFAAVLPYRLGAIGEDPPGTFKSDTVTLLYVPTTAAQTTIRDPMPPQSSETKVNAEPGCPLGDDLCGFTIGMTTLIFDESGTWDDMVITEVQAPALHLQKRAANFSKRYEAGSYISELAVHTYYLKTLVDSDTFQLMHYDGWQTDAPVVDNVVGLRFEYFGEPQPPILRKALTEPVGPWTTYGPRPPALGVDAPDDDYPAGENCIFKVEGGLHVPRLATLSSGTNTLAPLDQSILTDGPWCPSSAAPNRFDADLLRIRKVRMTVRLQAADKSLRGPTGPLFVRGGTGRAADRFVPDQEVAVDIAPRNLNLGR